MKSLKINRRGKEEEGELISGCRKITLMNGRDRFSPKKGKRGSPARLRSLQTSMPIVNRVVSRTSVLMITITALLQTVPVSADVRG